MIVVFLYDTRPLASADVSCARAVVLLVCSAYGDHCVLEEVECLVDSNLGTDPSAIVFRDHHMIHIDSFSEQSKLHEESE